VLIVGGNGNLGKYVTNGFLEAKPAWKVSLLVSPTSLADATKKAGYDDFVKRGAQLITGEIEKPETYQDKIKGIDVVVSVVGGMIVKSQIQLIQALKHAGTKLFLPSEFGGNQSIRTVSKSFAPKIEIQNEIKKAGLNYMLIATGLLYDYFLKPWFGTIIQNKQVATYGERNAKVSSVSLRDMGLVLPDIVNDPSLLNKYVEISGDQTTTGHIADELVALAGPDTKVTQYTVNQLQETMKKKEQEGQMTIVEEILLSIATGENYFEKPIDVSKYGKKLATFHEFIQEQKKL